MHERLCGAKDPEHPRHRMTPHPASLHGYTFMLYQLYTSSLNRVPYKKQMFGSLCIRLGDFRPTFSSSGFNFKMNYLVTAATGIGWNPILTRDSRLKNDKRTLDKIVREKHDCRVLAGILYSFRCTFFTLVSVGTVEAKLVRGLLFVMTKLSPTKLCLFIFRNTSRLPA